jgi:hypothetical protein
MWVYHRQHLRPMCMSLNQYRMPCSWTLMLLVWYTIRNSPRVRVILCIRLQSPSPSWRQHWLYYKRTVYWNARRCTSPCTGIAYQDNLQVHVSPLRRVSAICAPLPSVLGRHKTRRRPLSVRPHISPVRHFLESHRFYLGSSASYGSLYHVLVWLPTLSIIVPFASHILPISLCQSLQHRTLSMDIIVPQCPLVPSSAVP